MIRVFHPSTAPHVLQAALALQEAGQLDSLVTSWVNKPDSFTQGLLCATGKLFGIDLALEFARRSVDQIPAEKIVSHGWGELLRVAVSRLDRDQRLSDLVWEQTEGAFDRSVARSLHSGLNGVYGFEYSSRRTFSRARQLGLGVAYEMPAPEPVFVHELLKAERERFPELETPYTRHVARRERMWIDHRRQEWDAADVVIAASRFTRDSYDRAGWPTEKVRVVPIGAPDPVSIDCASKGGSHDGGKLKLLWVGTFGVRKGAHYALEAWKQHGLHRMAQLDVYGSPALPPRLVADTPEGIHFHGSVPRSVLWEKYERADALLFPTLCDGFGMVVTEAWSRGLPVLTTQRAGAAELLQDGINGRLMQPADAASIAQTVEWCAAERTTLRTMRLASRQTAADWTWADYRSALRQALGPLLRKTSV